jgi:hypothetical protein
MSNFVKINIALGIIACFLIYVTCKTKSQPATPITNTSTTTAPAPPAVTGIPVASLPSPTASRRSYLATGFWHIKHAVSITDSTAYKNYNPKVLKFRENQTFDIYLDNKVAMSGNWAFIEESMEIYLSCSDPWFNNSWKVVENGFSMVLVGNTDLNKTGVQVRMYSRPAVDIK